MKAWVKKILEHQSSFHEQCCSFKECFCAERLYIPTPDPEMEKIAEEVGLIDPPVKRL